MTDDEIRALIEPLKSKVAELQTKNEELESKLATSGSGWASGVPMHLRMGDPSIKGDPKFARRVTIATGGAEEGFYNIVDGRVLNNPKESE